MYRSSKAFIDWMNDKVKLQMYLLLISSIFESYVKELDNLSIISKMTITKKLVKNAIKVNFYFKLFNVLIF